MSETQGQPPESPITPPPSDPDDEEPGSAPDPGEQGGYEDVSGGETTPPSGAPEIADDR